MEELKKLLEEVLNNQALIYARIIELEKSQRGSSATHHYVPDAISEMKNLKRDNAQALSSLH